MKKIIIGLSSIVFIVLSSFILARMWPVEPYFTCSDYCPLPQEQYMINVYKGVENSFLCYALWGKPGIVYGWGERAYCEALLK